MEWIRLVVALQFYFFLYTEIMQSSQNIWMKGEWFFTVRDIHTGMEKYFHDYNVIPTVAKTAFAAQMAWDNTTDIWDNLYIALGSNTTTPAAWDTQLWTEVTRKAASSTTFSGAIGYVSAFFAAWEATWTHREFWLFGNWNTTTCSGVANSGILFSHVATNITVSATETLTCTFQITFS